MATARKLPSGSWRVRMYIGSDEDGKKQYKSFTGKTKKEAEKKALNYTVIHTQTQDITFGEAFHRYIESKRNILSPTTIRGYQAIERNYINRLKRVKLTQITNEILQKQLDDVAIDHSAKTVNNTRGVITATLKMFIPSFVVDIKGSPKEKNTVHIPSDEDIHRILDAVAGTDVELPILLSAFGSLRRGEVCAIFPDCVHDTYITVKRVIVLNTQNRWEIRERPKTYAGYRDITLPEDIMEKVKAAASECPNDQPILKYKPDGLYKRFRKATEAAGVYPYKYHSLRHYFATFCHSIGIPDQYIMEMGGWDDIGTLTKIYQHTMGSKRENINNKISQYYDQIKIYDTKYDTNKKEPAV